jgi:endonuclease/exonuclease/phosphatase (EEP) superfamily protein YafD
MEQVWIFVVAAVVVAGLVIGLRMKRNGHARPTFESEREAALTKCVAANAKCSLVAALESVRQELRFSPQQTDDVLVKRAVYHYHQANPPEHRVTYCDPVRG